MSNKLLNKSELFQLLLIYIQIVCHYIYVFDIQVIVW